MEHRGFRLSQKERDVTSQKMKAKEALSAISYQRLCIDNKLSSMVECLF